MTAFAPLRNKWIRCFQKFLLCGRKRKGLCVVLMVPERKQGLGFFLIKEARKPSSVFKISPPQRERIDQLRSIGCPGCIGSQG